MQTLTTIGGVAAAMGPAVKKASKVAGLSDFVDATHLLKPASNRSDGPTRRSAKNSGRMPFRDLESQWTRHDGNEYQRYKRLITSSCA